MSFSKNEMQGEAMVLSRGQTMSEYALILSLVAVVGLAAWALLGTNITALINQIAGCI